MRKLQLYLLSLGFFLAVFFVVFWAVELPLRYWTLKDSTESRDHVHEASYMPVKFKGNYSGTFWGVPFRTNKYGFRDEPDFPPDPEPGEYRILSLGDSIGFGLGIPSEDHYTKVAERQLNQLPSTVAFNIVNAAGQGYSPSSYYLYLLHEGLELRPHMVIADIEMCTVITNEALLGWVPDQETSSLPRTLRGGRYLVCWDGNLLATAAAGGYFFEKTYVYTNLLRRFLNLMYRVSPPEPFRDQTRLGVTYYSLGFDRYVLDQERLESGWHKTFASLLGMQELLETEGIHFLLMIIPSRYMFEPEETPQKEFARKLMERGVARAQELGIHHIDFTEAVGTSGGENLYYDFAHLTSLGNRFVGDQLFDELAAKFERQSLVAHSGNRPIQNSPSSHSPGME
jgi:hypothetical protein